MKGAPLKVLVTGASGFLGSSVVRALLRAGDQPRALVRRTSNRAALEGLPIKLAEGDVLDRRSIVRALKGVDAVIHVAGSVSLRQRDRALLEKVNVQGTRNVLEAAAERDLRVIHTSTIATLGFSDRPRLLDESCRISGALAALYPYAGTKLESEDDALRMAAAGADIVVLSPGLLLGAGDLAISSTRFIYHYLRREVFCFPDGGTSLGHVANVAAVYPTALRRGRRGERYILAGVNASYREVFGALSRIARLPPAWPLPAMIARWWGWTSDLASTLVRHPFEEFSLGTVSCSSKFNFCDCSKATATFRYRPGQLEPMLEETVADHLGRGLAARPDARAAVRRGF
jgi:dihydroflavonol-4-reductase